MPPVQPKAARPQAWRAWLRAGRDALFLMADWLLLLAIRRQPRRGVAVIMPHGLGDLVLYTPAFHHLRAHYPGEPVLLVCSEAARDYAEGWLKPDRIIALDRIGMRRNLPRRLRVLAAFARAGCRVVVQPGFNRDHMIEDALVRVSRAEQRIGASGTDMFITARQRARGDRWYTRVVPESHGQPHDIERNAHFAWALTGSTLAAPWPHLQRPPRPASAPRDGYIVVASEASAALKAWPAERFFAAAQAVAAPAALRLVLVGQTRGAQPAPEGALDLRGQTTLAALGGLLAHARLVMANDSSPAHLAAALGVPVVAVSGGGMPGRYLPYPPGTAATGQPGLVMVEPAWSCFGCGWRCRYALGRETSTPCVTAVGVEQVVLAARALLS